MLSIAPGKSFGQRAGNISMNTLEQKMNDLETRLAAMETLMRSLNITKEYGRVIIRAHNVEAERFDVKKDDKYMVSLVATANGGLLQINDNDDNSLVHLAGDEDGGRLDIYKKDANVASLHAG